MKTQRWDIVCSSGGDKAPANHQPTNQPTKKMTQSAQQAYLAAYYRAMEELKNLESRIHDMPAPDGEIVIHWGHVGDMNRIADSLAEIVPNGI